MTTENIHPEEFGYHFSSGNFDRIYRQTASLFKARMNMDDFAEAAEEFRDGTEKFQLKHQSQLEPGIRRFCWVDAGTERMIVTAFNDAGEIVGVQFDIYEKFKTDRVLTINRYQLPFTGEWFVLWGGANNFVNYHYPHKHQRYAYDFIRKEGGMAHSGDPDDLNAYYAYSSPVTAPAAGKVVRVLEGIADNAPFEMNTDAPEGNAIIIEHANKEYSLLAHLRNRSILVEAGDEVSAGEMIAQCGNSGASDTPHLHFHVMDGIEPHEADAIRIQFASGREPVQGDTVRGRK
ncbi:M23 family metallopeptidase [Lacicoccus alkaliphilus]|uniref:Peptidase family M23 n=1 Tax=Lacicoccus alkaliphilus DSM 16010 TaxID=1123231 RepID=A0A1M7J5Q7_9BACL|nr:M23 family metallopeptidase [Salinicoccus alkaliphilus]SHM48439.1 Peptidase family M23 [Salinicoccus alkaliphilus DSM 16010]